MGRGCLNNNAYMHDIYEHVSLARRSVQLAIAEMPVQCFGVNCDCCTSETVATNRRLMCLLYLLLS